ncbi:polyprenyl synthetase family protein [Pseudomonas sp. 15FMM2]|uniref:Polyprenyl synthetase family protein n=1 Tax=Pseudomonas imrae TaxID=2992837 RepID=A0ACC7PI43_9PSED
MINTALKFDASYQAQAKAQWREPFEYQEKSGGKKVRTELAWALSALYNLPATQTHVLCDAIEHINLSSLIHDDLLDGDLVRRGVASVWAKYGPGVALISGMYGYLHGLERLTSLNNMEVVRAALAALESLHVGQHLDAKFSDGDTLPTLEQYRFIAQTNTSCLFVFLLTACQSLSPLKEHVHIGLKELLLELGVYYRYVNDYCDINYVPHFEKKGFAPDLEGGPKSFLMILADRPLLKGKRTMEQKSQIIQEFGRAGVFDTALTMMEDTYLRIEQRLESISQESVRHNVKPLVDFVRNMRFQPGPNDNYYTQRIT